jgi:hypothetical protein
MPRQEVRVEVSQNDVTDGVARRRCVVQILLDIPLRIDDGRLFGSFVRDQVRGVSQTAQVILLEKHGGAPVVRLPK